MNATRSNNVAKTTTATFLLFLMYFVHAFLLRCKTNHINAYLVKIENCAQWSFSEKKNKAVFPVMNLSKRLPPESKAALSLSQKHACVPNAHATLAGDQNRL